MPKQPRTRSPAQTRRRIREAARDAGLPPPNAAELAAYLGGKPTEAEVQAHQALLARERAEKPS